MVRALLMSSRGINEMALMDEKTKEQVRDRQVAEELRCSLGRELSCLIRLGRAVRGDSGFLRRSKVADPVGFARSSLKKLSVAQIEKRNDRRMKLTVLRPATVSSAFGPPAGKGDTRSRA